MNTLLAQRIEIDSPRDLALLHTSRTTGRAVREGWFLADSEDGMPFASPPEYTEHAEVGQRFTVFSDLPVELRLRVWEQALKPRIVKRQRVDSKVIFTAPADSLPLLAVCQESRTAAFLYGKYQTFTPDSRTYFSPVFDYLWLSPGWGNGLDVSTPEWKVLFPEFNIVRNVMILHSQSNGGASNRPAPLLAQFPSIKKVILAIDEKFLRAAAAKGAIDYMNNIKKDYNDLKQASDKDQTITQFEFPYIAVGCVGWSGIERRVIQHGGGDNRQLVAVFENIEEIKAHLASLREEEWRFTKKHIARPKVFDKIRRAMERKAGEGSTVKRENHTEETASQVDSQKVSL